jgi:hypothetical protein
MSFSHLSSFFLWCEPIHFPSKMVPCRFSLDLPLFGLRPSSRGHGSDLWLSTNRIALFNCTFDSHLNLLVHIAFHMVFFASSLVPLRGRAQIQFFKGLPTSPLLKIHMPIMQNSHAPYCPNHENHYVMESAGYKKHCAQFCSPFKNFGSPKFLLNHIL